MTMFILDTNVVSELMRERPQDEVLAWIDRQLTDNLYVTAVTEAKVRTGIAILPEGERRERLATAANRVFGSFFAERVLPFDSEAAQAYAVIAAERRAAGHPVSQPDCEIAAIARCRGMSVATRDIDGFDGSGVRMVNPWGDES